MLKLSFIFAIVSGLSLVGTNLRRYFLFVYVCIAIRDPNHVIISPVTVFIFFNITETIIYIRYNIRGRRGRDSMVVGFTTTCAISTYHH
jgi:hypothetical protein